MPELRADMRAVVKESPIAWLATSRSDGSAHVTPVWFVFGSGTFWIATARRNVKVRNVERDPRASVAIDGSASSGGVVAEGSVVVRALDDPSVRRAFAEKYEGWDVNDPAPDGERVLLVLEVRRWLLGG